jgi:holliday junction DNA helicase RuvA
MIAFLIGEVDSVKAEEVLLNVQGVGYRVAVPISVSQKVRAMPQPVKLITHQVIREDQHSLYGFLTEREESLFSLIISVSGVGPKIGLKVCSFFSPDSFANVIAQADVKHLTQVPGIGKKVAERLVMELKDKLGVADLSDDTGMTVPVMGIAENSLESDLSLALKQLGYSPSEIRQAMGRAAGQLDESMTLEAGLKLVLKQLL